MINVYVVLVIYTGNSVINEYVVLVIYTGNSVIKMKYCYSFPTYNTSAAENILFQKIVSKCVCRWERVKRAVDHHFNK